MSKISKDCQIHVLAVLTQLNELSPIERELFLSLGACRSFEEAKKRMGTLDPAIQDKMIGIIVLMNKFTSEDRRVYLSLRDKSFEQCKKILGL